MRSVALVALMLLAACDIANPPPTTTPPPVTGWESVETVTTTDAYVIEKVSYRSSGLRVYGQVCRPTAPGRHKVSVWNHGGFSGLAAADTTICTDTAQAGIVAFQSAYRGEGGSDGQIEVCDGEVDDTLAMLRIGLEQPYTDPAGVFMAGGSHGGCITARAIATGVDLTGAAIISGAGDWAADYTGWQVQRDKPGATDATRQFFDRLIGVLTTATGGTPDEQPDEYRSRSPLYTGGLGAFDSPVLILHGNNDVVIPPSDSCRLAGMLGGFHGIHVTTTGGVTAAPPAGCDLPGIVWQADPKPVGSWPEARYLVVYDGAGHNADPRLLGDMRSFMLDTLR